MTTAQSARGLYAWGARPELLWTEYWYLLAAAVALIVVVDPLEWRLADNTVLKHLAIAVALPAIVLTLMGRQWNMSAGPLAARYARLMRAARPLLLLALLIVGGSLYARFGVGLQNTSLNVGLYMLTTVCAAVMVLQSDEPGALVRRYLQLLLAAALVMGISLILNYGVRQVYHEQIFLVIPLAGLFLTPVRVRFGHWAAAAFFLSMAWFSHKYTSYLIGVVTMVYLALAVGLARLSPHPRLTRLTVIYWASAFMVLAAIIGALALEHSSDLPTGNLGYRLPTYAAAWQRFLESPVWGTLFAGEVVEKFSLFTIDAGNLLPTHSDVLDLLANGGLIAAALWLLGLANIGRIAYGSLLRPALARHPWAPYGHTLMLMMLAGVITYAFNPILLQPSMAYLLWTSLGMLLGIALRAAEATVPSPARPDARGATRPQHAYGSTRHGQG